MIWHEAVCPDVTAGTQLCPGDQFEIRLIILCVKKSPLSSITTLRDVMRITWNDEPGDAGHSESRFGDFPGLAK